jgi:phosphoglycolate phosphatase-like HAD superfamily hydrolase
MAERFSTGSNFVRTTRPVAAVAVSRLLGFAEQVAAEFEADLSKCFVVGDKACDIELGRRVGATTILVRTGYGDRTRQQQGLDPDHVASDLLEAAEIIGRLIRSGDHRGLSSA